VEHLLLMNAPYRFGQSNIGNSERFLYRINDRLDRRLLPPQLMAEV
jgi:hypothetical protein